MDFFIDFKQISFEDVLDYFANLMDLEPRIDQSAMSVAGPTISKILITDNIRGMTRREALQRVLGPYGLGFRIEKNQLVITSRDEAERARAGIERLQQTLPNLRYVKVGW